jgi:FAD/FMN-containing dehydrogenase
MKTIIQPSPIEELQSSVKGQVLVAGDAGYDEARAIWNSMIDRHPSVIVQCTGTDDVVQALNVGRKHDMLIAVKGGGHNVAGNAVCEGGLMIDLSPMKAVRVDAVRQTAVIEAGCLLADVDRETQRYGMAVPGGIVSTTGIAGLTLGGGFGWISRKYGLTVDNLLSAEVVTASGEVVIASPEENPDLFWGVRGGGGNFGIVTRFTFRLHKLGPEVFTGLIVHPASDARQLLQFHREFVAQAPDELSVWLVIRKAPPLPFLPQVVHGQPVVVVAFCYAGDAREGERLMAPYRSWGSPHAEHVGMNPFTGWQAAFDALNAHGARNYWKTHNFEELSDAAIDAVLQHANNLPSSSCEIFIANLGGAVNRVPADATAYPHRNTQFVMNVHTRWTEPSEDQRHINWAKNFFEETKPYALGSLYVNFLNNKEEEQIQKAYPGETWKRLVTLKRKYDPQNLFRLNQNISPQQDK